MAKKHDSQLFIIAKADGIKHNIFVCFLNFIYSYILATILFKVYVRPLMKIYSATSAAFEVK